MKRIAILQSNYIPWKGYFDLINMVDEFIFYDDMQYTKRDWRNRNKIKTLNGLAWLSIPVEVKGKFFQKINETKISEKDWAKKHWQSISHNYSKAKYFKDYKDIFEDLYLNCSEEYLSQINYKFITTINKILDIDTKLRWSSEFKLIDGQTEKLIGICKECDADIYLSGPAAKDYFDEGLAEKEGIKMEWMDYSGYKEYTQLHPPFEHGVSILDLLFNEGENAKKFMKSFN
ncbi:WbqC family protein [Campylobacter sp. RM9344]|uniref:WbqC family protein n=1 Tax=Campylobacter californiensis TaxID=1032243 RepID=A0AAW3ZUM7_9BACT|nr:MULTISPECIES: WbqC family protein [unclassified Campylobacter]MBE2983886.1 WbqC family protein [Campylobacter sp. RM6883]MBE2994424.1 WbqC family protein [Campylobacter sp. RM6913]MBE3028732.1 WbqC family protein [Campylobacter sp. RM9344]MBE3607621.1 WbqC family protein [Campylobacter sp. RM9337]QCD51013.1 WbqC family protein [Campylobacter sp. RM6914]